ncbi:retrotransposon protein, putative, ty1-copia subclass [Tanacetum coccineum]
MRGVIIVSREGASYFITFIDDFIRYGYVYLMKHKHEVFENFKVFQNDVENQLSKKIKAIRSDRGGEYLSHMFVNHMKSCGIGYALETTARILNMVPTKKFERTPYEIWHGKASKLLYLRVWGCEALMKRGAPDKLDPRSIKSARIPQAPDRYGFYVDVEEYKLGDLNEPPNYKAALSNPEFDKWLEAMKQSMKDNQVWVLVDLPPDGRTIGNYGETFSPVADIRPIRILLAIATFYDYEIWQMDVKPNFLNGHLSEDIYMVQPERFVDPKDPNKVCELQRSIYELKQASRSWNKRFDVEIKKISFTQNIDEPCVYIKASRSNVVFLILYVDDILLMGNSVTILQEVKSWLCSIMYAVRSIPMYLRNTKDMVLVYGAKPEAEKYIVMLMLKSAKKSTTAMSSIEAEYIVVAEASIEAI